MVRAVLTDLLKGKEVSKKVTDHLVSRSALERRRSEERDPLDASCDYRTSIVAPSILVVYRPARIAVQVDA
jgi:hypothetical protein